MRTASGCVATFCQSSIVLGLYVLAISNYRPPNREQSFMFPHATFYLPCKEFATFNTNSRRETMKKILLTLVLAMSSLMGCDTLRFAPTEAQKQNAWLHNRTALVAAETAKVEQTSAKLQALTQLGELPKSRDCRGYSRPIELAACRHSFGRISRAPRPLAGCGFHVRVGYWHLCFVGRCVRHQSRALLERRPDKIAGVEGDYHRQRTVQKAKSALPYASLFKEAHQAQSSQTRQLVAQMKGEKNV